MVECQLPKLDVAGSSPVSRSIFSKTYGRMATAEPDSNGVQVCCVLPQRIATKGLVRSECQRITLGVNRLPCPQRILKTGLADVGIDLARANRK